MTDKVAIEVAEKEFERFVDSADLDVDTAHMDADDQAGFEKTKRRLLRAICDGSLIINEKDEPVYTPKNTDDVEPITFHERTGASIMAMDGKKKNHNVAQMYAIMGEMTKRHPNTFAKLVGIDIKICESIFMLLMD